MTATEKLARYQELAQQIREIEGLLASQECVGSDRRSAKSQLARLHAEYHALRRGVTVATTGEAALIASADREVM